MVTSGVAPDMLMFFMPNSQHEIQRIMLPYPGSITMGSCCRYCIQMMQIRREFIHWFATTPATRCLF
jgi:hypothetical protein